MFGCDVTCVGVSDAGADAVTITDGTTGDVTFAVASDTCTYAGTLGRDVGSDIGIDADASDVVCSRETGWFVGTCICLLL